MAESRDGEFAAEGKWKSFGIVEDKRIPRFVRRTLQCGVRRCECSDSRSNRRLLCWSLFWHALDIVWVGVFTLVYLMGD